MPTYLVGPTRTYTTIQAALNAIPGGGTGNSLIAIGSGVHTVQIDAGVYPESLGFGKNGNANDYLVMQAAPGGEHKMVRGAGVVIGIAGQTVVLQSTFQRLYNLQFKTVVQADTQNQILENIAIFNEGNFGGILTQEATGSISYLRNCLVVCLGPSPINPGFNFGGLGGLIVCENCGTYNTQGGFYAVSGVTVRYINCWEYRLNTSFYTSGYFTTQGGLNDTVNSRNNASITSSVPGTNNLVNQTLAKYGFVDSSNNNFHILRSSVLYNSGYDLSDEFTKDVDLETIALWCIGPDSYPSNQPAPTTSSSPAKKNENHNRPIPDAKPPGLRLQYSTSVAASNRAKTEKDASAPTIKSQRGEPSNGFNHNQNQSSPGELSGVNANRGQPNGYISVTPNLGAYAGIVIDGKGMRLYADKENLQVGAQYRDLDLVGNGRAINNRAHLPNLPQGQFTFTPRSNDILAPLMAHFQLRTGSALSGGTTYYEFTPSLRSPSTFGSNFGTGTYGLSGDMFTVNVTKLVNGSAIRFNQGVCDTLVWDFKANDDFSLTSEYRFKSVSLIGSSSAGSTGSYSSLPSFSGFNSSIDFMGVAPVDFKLTLKNKVSDYKPAGGTYSYYKFMDYFVEGNATIDLSKVSLAYLGSMLGTQSFSISGTLNNSLADRIIFQIPNCRMNDFDLKLGENTISIPFRAYEPDAFSAPIKVMVWTQHYSATTFEPN